MNIQDKRPRDPLHGVTLEMMLTALVDKLGWEELARGIRINCFANNPSIKSSLNFLRKTPWARAKVEGLYKRCMVRGRGAGSRGKGQGSREGSAVDRLRP